MPGTRVDGEKYRYKAKSAFSNKLRGGNSLHRSVDIVS